MDAAPDKIFDPGLQQERTSLAWERTAVATMVAGTLLARYGAEDAHLFIALVGIVQVAVGGALLVWAGSHYEDLHEPLRKGEAIVFTGVVRAVGLLTIAFTGAALALAITVTATG